MAIPCKSGQFLTMSQLQNYLRQAGFAESDIVTMSAICKQESQLCPLASNKVGEYSIGLFQINMKAHGTRFGTEQELYNPLTNCKAALVLRKTQGLKAWGAYTHPIGNPAYKKYLPEAQAAYNGKAVTNTNIINNASQLPLDTSKNNDSSPLAKLTTNEKYILAGAGFLVLILLTR